VSEKILQITVDNPLAIQYALNMKNSIPETAPVFTERQRVRILPCKHFPPTAQPGGIRYGIVVGMTRYPGMYFVNEDRDSKAGEWAYIVASYHHQNAGALWFSANGLEPMKRNRLKIVSESN
jgi:hypothetical protein